MPATQSPYVTFAKMQQVLKAKRPELKVVTTEAAYIQMLASGVLPSRFVIEMANADGDVVSSQIKEFARGKILNQTAAEKKKRLIGMKEKGKSTREMEIQSMKDLGEILAKEGVNLVDLTRKIEGCRADGYIFETGANHGDVFVGVQVTYANKGSRTNSHAFGKSKQEIVESVVERQFLFAGLFYVDGEVCGALLLTPDDSALIESLPNITTIQLKAIGRNSKKKVDPDSLYWKLLPHLFIWKENGKVKAEVLKQFGERILAFLPSARKKYSEEDFASMITDNCLIERKYIESFTTIFKDASRMESGHVGDILFRITANGVQLFAEMRMMYKTGPTHQATVYRGRHALSVVNSISVFIFVISDNDQVDHSSKAPADYNRFIVFPARTPDGEANLCYEHVEGKKSALTLRCDTATGQVSIVSIRKRVRNEDEYLVIMAGEAVTEQTSKTLQEWAERPKMVVTLSADDEPIAPPALKLRKFTHQAVFDSESSIDSASDDFDAPPIVTTLQRRQQPSSASAANADELKQSKYDLDCFDVDFGI